LLYFKKLASTNDSAELQHAEALSEKIIAKCFGADGGIMSSPMDLIKNGMELARDIASISGVERKKCLVAALQIVARGKDGISGTEDDLIAPENLKMLSIMLEHNIVEHIVDALVDAAKGRLNIIAVKDALVDTAVVGAGCIDWCMWRHSRKPAAASAPAPAK